MGGRLSTLALLALRTLVSGWGISVAFHCAAFVLLAIWFVRVPQDAGGGLDLVASFVGSGGQGAMDDPLDGVSLASERPIARGSSGSGAAVAESSSAALATALDNAAKVDPLGSLPAAVAAPLATAAATATGDAATQGNALAAGAGAAKQSSAGNASPRSGRPLDYGKGRTQVFGTTGEGYRFVYVFDRSGSMGGSGRTALAAAKSELLASLAKLQPTHQFEIIFYNDRVYPFSSTEQNGRLPFATDQNKRLAEQFVASITADSGTRHEEALSAAIRLRPDVIFFLTDADEPKLWPAQLERLHRMAGGITINAIEFGYGPQMEDDNFLMRLARDNGGQHVYVDVSKLLPIGGN